MKTLAVIMDPLTSLHVEKDTTLALLLAAQQRDWRILYLEMQHLFLRDGIAWGEVRELKLDLQCSPWFQLSDAQEVELGSIDVILQRKDPPFDMEYIYSTYLLERAEEAGALVVNHPQSLRDANEKLFTAWFPQCCPPTLVTRSAARIKAFIAEQQDIILKPLDGMGGASIFRLTPHDANLNVIIETLTHHGQQQCMAQRYIPAVTQGDKRILLLNGVAVPYALARIPAAGETRANLAVGGKGVAQPLSERDHWIVQQVAPELIRRRLYFVGLDVIGDYLTEINVTSPTGLRQLDDAYQLDIGGDFMNMLETLLARS